MSKDVPVLANKFPRGGDRLRSGIVNKAGEPHAKSAACGFSRHGMLFHQRQAKQEREGDED